MNMWIKRTAGFVLAVMTIVAFSYSATASAAGCQVLSKKTLERKASLYKKTIRSASSKYGVNEDLIKAVITVESCFRQKARGTSGEKGLMQLMPATARRFNVRRGYNSWENVHGGTKYLSYLFKHYRGDARRAVAAYNAGEGNVKPGRRIRNIGYVNKVMRAYNKLSHGKQGKIFHAHKAYKPTKTALKKSTANKSSQQINKRAVRNTRNTTNNRQVFTVKKGHTVYEVMRQTGVPVKKIISLNGLKAPYHINTGQYLRLR